MLTVEARGRRQWCLSGAFIVNLIISFTHFSVVSIVDFEQVIAGWNMRL